MPKEGLHRLSQEGKGIGGKRSEAANATILGKAKAPNKLSDFVNLHDVTLGELMKSSFHQFDFINTPNGTSKNDIIDKDHHTYNYGDNSMITTNLSKRYKGSPTDIRKILSSPNPYSTQEIKYLVIESELYHHIDNPFIYVSSHNHTHCLQLVDWGANVGVDGEDVTVFNTSQHRHVKILGIDNHYITSVPISIVGDLAH